MANEEDKTVAVARVRNIYIRIVASHALELYEDREGSVPLELEAEQPVKKGTTLTFSFILNNNFGHHWPTHAQSPLKILEPDQTYPPTAKFIETAALVIIAQTEHERDTASLMSGKAKPGWPFRGGAGTLGNGRIHYLGDPGEGANENGTRHHSNLHGMRKGVVTIEAGSITYKGNAGDGDTEGPFKWAIVALCDGGAAYCEIDPRDVLER